MPVWNELQELARKVADKLVRKVVGIEEEAGVTVMELAEHSWTANEAIALLAVKQWAHIVGIFCFSSSGAYCGHLLLFFMWCV